METMSRQVTKASIAPPAPSAIPQRGKGPKPDPCAADCPVARAARILDGRWTTRIVRDLLPGKRRYVELLRSLAGISPKVLAARLRFLEAEGILTKTIYAEVPPRTEYQLTPLGFRLRSVIEAMASFGNER
jgi:DNA-binding HxlR family transcriptional regulator